MKNVSEPVDRPRWLTARTTRLAGGLGVAFAVLFLMQLVSHVLIDPDGGPPWFLLTAAIWGLLASFHIASWRWLRTHPGAASSGQHS